MSDKKAEPAVYRQLSADMRQGLKDHGPVREGVYAATGYEGIEAHDARLKAEREMR